MFSIMQALLQLCLDFLSCQQALAKALQTAEVDNKHAIARKVIIEKRKEAAERDLAQKEQQEEQDRILQARIQVQQEEERRKQEMCAVPSALRGLTILGGMESVWWHLSAQRTRKLQLTVRQQRADQSVLQLHQLLFIRREKISTC